MLRHWRFKVQAFSLAGLVLLSIMDPSRIGLHHLDPLLPDSCKATFRKPVKQGTSVDFSNLKH